MKNLKSIVLIIAMLLTLTACGGNKPTPSQKPYVAGQFGSSMTDGDTVDAGEQKESEVSVPVETTGNADGAAWPVLDEFVPEGVWDVVLFHDDYLFDAVSGKVSSAAGDIADFTYDEQTGSLVITGGDEKMGIVIHYIISTKDGKPWMELEKVSMSGMNDQGIKETIERSREEQRAEILRGRDESETYDPTAGYLYGPASEFTPDGGWLWYQPFENMDIKLIFNDDMMGQGLCMLEYMNDGYDTLLKRDLINFRQEDQTLSTRPLGDGGFEMMATHAIQPVPTVSNAFFFRYKKYTSDDSYTIFSVGLIRAWDQDERFTSTFEAAGTWLSDLNGNVFFFDFETVPGRVVTDLEALVEGDSYESYAYDYADSVLKIYTPDFTQSYYIDMIDGELRLYYNEQEWDGELFTNDWSGVFAPDGTLFSADGYTEFGKRQM